LPVFAISALTGAGCRELTFAIAEFLAQAAEPLAGAAAQDAAASSTPA
jgi:hypothetical protein